jgi:hypothetical protein
LLSVPTVPGLSFEQQIGYARQRRRRDAVLLRAGAAAAVLLLMASLAVVLRPGATGWSVKASSPGSLHVASPSARGASLRGWGAGEVTTAAYFRAGDEVAVYGAGEPRVVTADHAGRLRFWVDLTPPFGTPLPGGVDSASVAFLPVPAR